MRKPLVAAVCRRVQEKDCLVAHAFFSSVFFSERRQTLRALWADIENSHNSLLKQRRRKEKSKARGEETEREKDEV